MLAQARPSFLFFWTIEELSRKRAALFRDARQGKVKVPKRERFEIAAMPGSYESYKPKNKLAFVVFLFVSHINLH